MANNGKVPLYCKEGTSKQMLAAALSGSSIYIIDLATRGISC